MIDKDVDLLVKLSQHSFFINCKKGVDVYE